MFESKNYTVENVDGRNKLQNGYSQIYNESYWIKYSQDDEYSDPIYVNSDGTVRMISNGQTNNYGVRPVITIPLSMLKYK